MIRLDSSSFGPHLLRSTLLESLRIPHAFSTRLGGVSAAPCDTLDCAGEAAEAAPGSAGADGRDRRLENRRRLLAAAELAGRAIAPIRLVHGADVVRAALAAENENGDRSPHRPAADAMVSNDPAMALLVTTADCAPILLACAACGAVGAVHCGWRGVLATPGGTVDQASRTGDAAGRCAVSASGTVAATACRSSDERVPLRGAIASALSALHGEAAPCAARSPLERASSVVAAIGPCIGPEAFEVGDEVACAFIAAGLGRCVIRRRTGGRPRIDLFASVHAQLVACGVDPGAIDGEPFCTASNPQLFFSHRRDRGRTGRMAAVIGAAALDGA
ncbi:MAG TPA: laccase domain-containing protein [Phycisphaerales bacterium]|nr:laccase domain-containing protein [Phycisphaerales bacterium]HMP37786.1 laccase domain-containing protein [Phycisphaerales bacterium]